VRVRLRELREEYPRWGREKLRVLLLAEGVVLSGKSIDRELARQRARGVLREPLRSRQIRRVRPDRQYRPPGLVVDHPGALVQVDTKYVAPQGGKTVYQFGGVDYFTRKRVVALVPRLTSAASRSFLEMLSAQFGFPVEAVQTDGGPEFLGDFAVGARQLGIQHYFNRPHYPQGNGRIERSFKTDEEEFYQVEDLPADLRGLHAKLQAWNHVYETVRPHQALGYLTPDAFYQQWLRTHPRKEVLSDMS
jgi:transposase InsO family protein